MSRFIAVYSAPKDPTTFGVSYRDTHIPLIKATPGVLKVEVSMIRRALRGDPAPWMIAVIHFKDNDAMRAGLATEQWRLAGENLAEIGGLELATMATLNEPETYEVESHAEPLDTSGTRPSTTSGGG